MDRLRSTSHARSSRRVRTRLLAVISIGSVLAVGGYYVVDSSPSTTVDSAPVQSAVVSASTDQASPSVTTFNVAVELAPTDPTRGGTVRVGVVGHSGTMNPLLTGSDRSLLAVHHLVGASALRLDPTTHDLTPGVFGTVPTIGSGGLTVNVDGSMTVRGEISMLSFWSDGTAMTGPTLRGPTTL